MPWPEMLTKDAKALFQILTRQSDSKTILCYPHFPSSGSTIAQIAKVNGWILTNKLTRKFDLAIFWEYGTVRQEDEPLRALKTRVINLESTNISKDYVDEKMLETFGYSTAIDPKTFVGVAVQKSNTNALHDGKKIECPTTPQPGFIYQKFIDSSISDSEVLDLRVVVMGGKLTHLYLNYRNNSERFKNVPDRSELCKSLDEHLNEKEQNELLSFCKATGLDYGELDVLRDCNDKKIYVVDANNTPQGPPRNLSEAEKKESIHLLDRGFKEAFVS